MKKSKLSRMKISEISAVDKGANQHADVLFTKKKDVHTMDNEAKKSLIEKILDYISGEEEGGEGGDIAKALSPEEAEYTKEMTAEEKAAFLALKPEQRKQTMTKSFTDIEKRFSDMEQSFEKKLTDQAADFEKKLGAKDDEIKKLRDERATEVFAKQAREEFNHLPGTEEERANMLKSIGAMPEAEREKALEGLRKANEIAGKFAKEAGNTPDESGTAGGKLEALAKSHSEKHNVSMTVARAAVLETAEGQKLAAEQAKA